jgi:hypothetical protein
LYERIDKAMKDSGRPLNMTDIRRLVIGNGQRIAAVVKQGVTQGRYASDGRGKAKYWINDASEPVMADWSTLQATAEEMADESGQQDVPLSDVRDRLEDEGYVL